LRALERQGAQISVVPCASDGTLDPTRLAAAMRRNTRLVVLVHASNVVGTVAPVAQVAEIAHAHGAKLLLDAAQTAGAMPMDMGALGVDLLAFTGHKGLLGPPGTGGLILGKDVDADEIEPLVAGGTGSNSEREEQPGFLPDKFESGTANGVGIAGLAAGIRYIMERGLANIRAHELRLTRLLLDGLRPIPGVTLYGPEDPEQRTAVISFRGAGWRVSEIGLRLDDEFGVLARVGLHCAPAAHRTLGTFPEGTVRLAPGVFTSEDDVEQTVAAVGKVMTA
ncbi:MAG: aminotransferase class V-fold PLP-dependent enzyme, partial [Chloroflexota bacterium]